MHGVKVVIDVKPRGGSRRSKPGTKGAGPAASPVGRLLSAHEDERRRISQEIHNDLGGRISEIALLARQVANRAAGLPADILSPLDQLLEKTMEAAKAIGSISHRLHSPILEFAGVTAGLESLCREFQTDTGVRVEFQGGLKVKDISGEAALCLYRVAEESLSNIAKHSGSARAEVLLTRTADNGQLTIRDFGKGFAASPKNQQGLGLISMQERVRLLAGALQVQTSPDGVQVRVSIPIRAQKAASAPLAKGAGGRLR
jgi:signal transduction histidine kinase